MKSCTQKTVRGQVLFALLVMLVLGFWGCSGGTAAKHKAAIENVIRQSRKIDEVLVPKLNDPNADYGKLFPELLAKYQAIDVTLCPPDFVEAFLRYVHALEDYNLWLPARKSTPEAIWILLTEDVPGRHQELQEAIGLRWPEVELIAIRYGVQATGE